MLTGIPEERIQFLKQNEEWCTIDTPALKRITEHCGNELDKGLSKDGGSIPMNVTWITSFPNGCEEGRVLTIDMGGTNLRVCDVNLPADRRDFEQTQKYRLPEAIKTSRGEQLWNWIADRLKEFMENRRIDASEAETVSLAFTFSFPVYRKNIRSGVLQRWTKNFNVAGAEGTMWSRSSKQHFRGK